MNQENNNMGQMPNQMEQPVPNPVPTPVEQPMTNPNEQPVPNPVPTPVEQPTTPVEEPKKKSNPILVAVLILVILGALGYLIYTNFISKEDTTNEEEKIIKVTYTTEYEDSYLEDTANIIANTMVTYKIKDNKLYKEKCNDGDEKCITEILRTATKDYMVKNNKTIIVDIISNLSDLATYYKSALSDYGIEAIAISINQLEYDEESKLDLKNKQQYEIEEKLTPNEE